MNPQPQLSFTKSSSFGMYCTTIYHCLIPLDPCLKHNKRWTILEIKLYLMTLVRLDWPAGCLHTISGDIMVGWDLVVSWITWLHAHKSLTKYIIIIIRFWKISVQYKNTIKKLWLGPKIRKLIIYLVNLSSMCWKL